MTIDFFLNNLASMDSNNFNNKVLIQLIKILIIFLNKRLESENEKAEFIVILYVKEIFIWDMGLVEVEI